MTEAGFSVFLRRATRSNPRNTEGDVVVLKDGRWLMVWSEFYGGSEDDARARIAGMLGTKNGRKWSEPFEVQPNVGKQNVMSASLLRLRSGALALFFGIKNSPTDLKFFMRISHDEAKSWGEPVCVTPVEGYHCLNNARVVQLSSGRLIAPVASSPEVWSAREHFTSSVFYSDDGGRTWRPSRKVADAPKRGAMEPGVVELRDGRLLMIIRTQLGCIYRAFSDDGGETWSAPEPMRYRPDGDPIKAPEAPATIARIAQTGDLLLVWNHNFVSGADHGGRRTPLTVAISRDEGETWTHIKDLETNPQHAYHYTAVRFVGEDVVLLYSEDLSLKLRIVPVKWFYE